MMLDTRRAVSIAKTFVTEQLGDEGIQDIGLEEVRREDDKWQITIGFSRPWDLRNRSWVAGLQPHHMRSYKVLVIADDTGEVVEMKNREAA